jgi:hypothetical protein
MRYIVFSTFLCISFTLFSQNETFSVKDIEFPNSPAFILLDQTPSVIERPTSCQALEVSILNSFQNQLTLPQNYAVEFSPFWFCKNNHMTALKYAGIDEKTQQQKYFSNIKKLSLSIAYLNSKDSVPLKSVNHLSLGIRLNLITVRSMKDVKDLKIAHDSVVGLIKNKVAARRIFVPDSISRTNPEFFAMKVQEFEEKYENEQEEQKSSFADVLARKPLFALDLAGGYSHFFLGNHFSDNHPGRLGVWLTASLSSPLGNNNNHNYINFYFFARYLFDGTHYFEQCYQREHFLDFGGKEEFVFSKLSLGIEFIYRIDNYSNTFRANGVISYQLSKQLLLMASFGKNFGDKDNLIFSLGLNVGFLQLIKNFSIIHHNEFQ